MRSFNMYPHATKVLNREAVAVAMGLLAAGGMVTACEQISSEVVARDPYHKDEYGEGTLGTSIGMSPQYEQAKSCHAATMKAWLEDARRLPLSQVVVHKSPAYQDELALRSFYQDGEDGYLLEVVEMVPPNDSSIGKIEFRGVVLDQEYIPSASDADEYILPLRSDTHKDMYTIIASSVVRTEGEKTPQDTFIAQVDSQTTFDDTATGIVRQEGSVALQDIARGEADISVAEYCEAMQTLTGRLDSK